MVYKAVRRRRRKRRKRSLQGAIAFSKYVDINYHIEKPGSPLVKFTHLGGGGGGGGGGERWKKERRQGKQG